MKIVSLTLLLGTERNYTKFKHGNSCYCIIITNENFRCSAAKKSPHAKDPPFRPDGKAKGHILLKFPAARNDNIQKR
jgi:hypothetical protein